jgi:Transcriptional regulator
MTTWSLTEGNMPNRIYLDLDKNKQDKIIEAGIAEFSECGFSTSSTNRIVKSAGISKGSLFKYFTNKEEYYFYIVDLVISEYCQYINQMKELPDEVFARIIKYAEYEFDWLVKNPLKYKLMKGVFLETDEEIRLKIERIYINRDIEIFNKIMKEADWGEENTSKERMINIVKWFLKGFNEEFEKIYDDGDLNICKKEYLEMLKIYINDLKDICKVQ